jgi:hypothetical protein
MSVSKVLSLAVRFNPKFSVLDAFQNGAVRYLNIHAM